MKKNIYSHFLFSQIIYKNIILFSFCFCFWILVQEIVKIPKCCLTCFYHFLYESLKIFTRKTSTLFKILMKTRYRNQIFFLKLNRLNSLFWGLGMECSMWRKIGSLIFNLILTIIMEKYQWVWVHFRQCFDMGYIQH